MITITDKTKCSGCTACASACPSKCISMQPDFEGFLYPVVDAEKCIDCGVCNKVCPIETPIVVKDSLMQSFTVRTKDIEVLKNSTSGGFFTPLAEQILSNNGVICAAAYDENFAVKHTFLDGQDGWQPSDLKKFRGSKYVQSDVCGCFERIERLLKSGRQVCFVGTPCQVNGLKCYLRKVYDNLFTVDLVCHGVPSPKLWNTYLSWQKKRFKSTIKDIAFRSKTFGYHSGGFMQINFHNGKRYLASGRIDPMLKSFFKEISSRPICYRCPFKQGRRCSDLTIYDCWSYEKLTNKTDDDLGYTNVLVHSRIGLNSLQNLKNELVIYPVNTKSAIKQNGRMAETCPKAHPKRDSFYKELDSSPLLEHMKTFSLLSRKDYLIEGIKIVLYRLHFQRIKEFLKK